MANGGILPRSTGLAAILLVITSIFSPMRPLAMELKIVGNQIILSGLVVGDEPGKIREALANTPGIDTAILRNSPGGSPAACGGVAPEAAPKRAPSGW